MATALKHRLYFLRHGETDWNVAGRLQGQRDVPLNGRGRDQASAAGRVLRGVLTPSELEGVHYVASPLWRARETMQRAREAMGLSALPFATDDRLREISFGQWEGETWRGLRKQRPEAIAERERQPWAFVPPGGESYAMLAERLRPWAESLIGDTVAVSHGGVARALLALYAGMNRQEAVVAPIVQGRVLLFEAGVARWL